MVHSVTILSLLTVLSYGISAPTSNVCSKIADIAFVIDSSRSIAPKYFKKQIQFVHDILELFDLSPGKTRVSAVSFSNVVKHEFYFNSYDNKQDILAAIDKVKFTQGDGTRTYKGLEHMNDKLFQQSNGARTDVVQIAIVLTDGGTNPAGYDNNIGLRKAQEWTQREAQQAKDAGIFVFAIGIGSAIDVQELNGIASEPKSNFMIQVRSFEDLDTQQLKQLVAYRTCEVNDKPTPPPTPPPTPAPTTRRPQQEEPKKECKGMIADVIFVIDESSSLKEQKNFNLELNFVSKVVGNMDIGPNRTRVGVITFADLARTIFNLKDFSTAEEVQKAVNDISWEGGNTFTDFALDKMMSDGFSSENGARDGVSKVAVIITDGNSTNPYNTQLKAQEAQNKGIHVFAIGVGNTTMKELNYIASDPNEQYVFSVDNLHALDSIKEQLSINVCQNPQADQPKEVCPGKAADIVIISDASTSIGQLDFEKQLDFISDLVKEFDIGPDNVQVGMITFSTDAKKEFALNKYKTNVDLQAAIKQVQWTTGLTYTNKAIDLMLREAFSAADGARGYVPKICIVITDGWSRIPKETERLALKAKQGEGITMFSIGVGLYIVPEELEKIASYPADHYSFMVTDFSALEQIKNSLAARTCDAGTKNKPGSVLISR